MSDDELGFTEEYLDKIEADIDYSPTGFNDTVNTLAGFRPTGLDHPLMNSRETAEFQAERLLEAGYVIRYDKRRAEQILANRKS